jgi:asparagine synthase (glutamine-hydrolysing)
MQEYVSKLYDALVEATSECKANSLSFSGGLDSTIIAYLLKERIHGVSVIVSDYAAPDYTFIEIARKEFNIPVDIEYVNFEQLLPKIEEIIKIFQNFNFIEIRNYVGLYNIFQIVKNKNQKEIITGDAADELFAGYNFFLSKDYKEIDSDLKKIWQVMQFPSSKIATHFEMKVEHPYLNHKVKKLAQEIPVKFKVNTEQNRIYGKWILRKAFEGKISKSLLWRDKTPMGDGSGSAGLVTFFDKFYSDETYNKKLKNVKKEDDVTLYSKEHLYYYEIFRKHFDVPSKLNQSSTQCPDCKYEFNPDLPAFTTRRYGLKFCRMCGRFPFIK